MRKAATIGVVLLLSACPKQQVEQRDAAVEEPPSQTVADEPSPADVDPVRAELERVTSDLEGDGPLRAVLVTSLGDVNCELYERWTPRTVANFVGLARGKIEWLDPATREPRTEPLYQDLPFHRIVPGFAVQTGDPSGDGTGGPGYQFADEIVPELRHDAPGVLSMVNHGPDTNGSQFAILLAPAPHLDGRHTVFGKCEDGPTLKALGEVEVKDQRPLKPPTLEGIEITRATE